MENEVTRPGGKAPGLRGGDYLLLWGTLICWVVVFLTGTLINSAPYRDRLTSLTGTFYPDLLRDCLIVATSYTLTNVAILCVLAAVLGTLGRRSQLGGDSSVPAAEDSVSPRSSAILRGFVVYLAIISGVLILGDNPAQPTQTQYVRIAGLSSLLSFVLNWDPNLFVRLLKRIAEKSDEERAREQATSGK